MKLTRIYLMNDRGLVLGAMRDQKKKLGEFRPMEEFKDIQGELYYFTAQHQQIMRVRQVGKVIEKSLFHVSSIPGDGYCVAFFNFEQKEIELEEILNCKTMQEVIEKEQFVNKKI